VGVVEHLLDRYGSLATDVLRLLDDRPELVRPLEGAPAYLAVEVVYAVRAEAALHLEDALARRTRISFETVHRGAECAADAANLMGAELGWDAVRRRTEVDNYRARVEAERQSQTMPDDLSADAARLGAPDVRAAPAAAPAPMS
jgi:glycerol-3-phosphate dehydrogenase